VGFAGVEIVLCNQYGDYFWWSHCHRLEYKPLLKRLTTVWEETPTPIRNGYHRIRFSAAGLPCSLNWLLVTELA
jgi:hypothetical protein